MITTNSHIKYASALHRAALKAGAEQRVLHDLENLSAISADPQFSAILKKISWLEKTKLETALKETFKEALANHTMNLLVLLARARKLVLLPRIHDAYSHLYHEAKNIEEMKICTARELSPDERQIYIERLRQTMDKPISVKFASDPRLIGGVQVFSKGYVTDSSVESYLERMRKHLLSN